MRLTLWASALLTLIGAGCVPTEKTPDPVLGGDRDEHGCIRSAGYVWNAELGKCHRPWEKP